MLSYRLITYAVFAGRSSWLYSFCVVNFTANFQREHPERRRRMSRV